MIKKSLNSFFVYCLMLVFALPHVQANASIGKTNANGSDLLTAEPEKATEADLKALSPVNVGKGTYKTVDADGNAVEVESEVGYFSDEHKGHLQLLKTKIAKISPEKQEAEVMKYITMATESAMKKIELHDSGKKVMTAEDLNKTSEMVLALDAFKGDFFGGVNDDGVEVVGIVNELKAAGSTEPAVEAIDMLQTQYTESMGAVFGLDMKWWAVIGLFLAGLFFNGFFIFLAFILLIFLVIQTLGSTLGGFGRSVGRGIGGLREGMGG